MNQQQADGSFHDHHPVMDRSMQVGYPYLEEFVVHLELLGIESNIVGFWVTRNVSKENKSVM